MTDWHRYWLTEPQPNDPMTVEVCIDDVTPAVGQEVLVTLTASDPDAVIPDDCSMAVFWEGSFGDLCRDVFVMRPGPEPTPPEQPGNLAKTFAHVYEDSGSRTLTGRAFSGPPVGPHPYSSYARADIVVDVH